MTSRLTVPYAERPPRRYVLRKADKGYSVSEQEDKQAIAELEQLNAELSRSLARCRRLLSDCRSQLAANANMPELLDDHREESCA